MRMPFVRYENRGINFDECECLLKNVSINLPAIQNSVLNIHHRLKDKEAQIASLLRAVTCIDLTTLSGDDTESNVQRLCQKAVCPIDSNLLNSLGIDSKAFHVGAVCVYPSRVKDSVKYLKRLGSNIPVASVAAGFPSSQYHLTSKLEEIKACISDGAEEIDIVISRDLVMKGDWQGLYEEVACLKQACGSKISLKTIISAGELGSLDNIYKASIVCMAAGSTFIKTSTGKESVNATLPIGLTMVRAIQAYNLETKYKVGFKPAGGIRTTKDVQLWQALMERELGHEWLYPSLFRLGASGLLADIENNIFHFVTECQPSKHIFAYQ